MPLTNPMLPMDAETLIIVSLRDISPDILGSLSVEMGATSTEKIFDKVALHGLPDANYPPTRSGRYTAYKVQFGSADEANKAHACLNLHVTNYIAPYNTLFAFRPIQGGNRFSFFRIGTGVRHVTVISKTQERSQVFDILAEFGAASFLYPDEKVGWIVHFETEAEACKAESKILQVYDASAIKWIEIDPNVGHLNARLKHEITGLSSPDRAGAHPALAILMVVARRVVLFILLPLTPLAYAVVTLAHMLSMDSGKDINKSPLSSSTALAR